MARFQLHTVLWCSRSSSSFGSCPRVTHSNGDSGPITGSIGECSATASENSSSALSRTQPWPNVTRAWG